MICLLIPPRNPPSDLGMTCHRFRFRSGYDPFHILSIPHWAKAETVARPGEFCPLFMAQILAGHQSVYTYFNRVFHALCSLLDISYIHRANDDTSAFEFLQLKPNPSFFKSAKGGLNCLFTPSAKAL